MTSHVITPSWARAERRLIRSDFAELHADVHRARALRATGRILDAEDAEAILTMVWARHHGLRRRIKWLRTAKVEKYANLSADGKRMARFHATRSTTK